MKMVWRIRFALPSTSGDEIEAPQDLADWEPYATLPAFQGTMGRPLLLFRKQFPVDDSKEES